MKELVYAFTCACTVYGVIDALMRLGGIENLELLSAITSSNSYTSFVLSKLPMCIYNLICARYA